MHEIGGITDVRRSQKVLTLLEEHVHQAMYSMFKPEQIYEACQRLAQGHEPATWQRDLRLHNQARQRGWTLVRVPSPLLESPEGDALLEQVAQRCMD